MLVSRDRKNALNLNYLLGSTFSRVVNAILSSGWFPLTRGFPYGVSWVFDVQRLMRTRSLGVVFDVGANIGQTSTVLVRYAPTAEIYCFEPGSIPFRVLQEKFQDRKNVHLLNTALGSRPQRLALQVGAIDQFDVQLIVMHAGDLQVVVEIAGQGLVVVHQGRPPCWSCQSGMK